MQTGTSDPVGVIPYSETNQQNQYSSLQGRYNDYLTPYSPLQLATRSESVNNDGANDYARIGDISSDPPEHGYSTLHDNRPEFQDPPPSYEESQKAVAIQKN